MNLNQIKEVTKVSIGTLSKIFNDEGPKINGTFIKFGKICNVPPESFYNMKGKDIRMMVEKAITKRKGNFINKLKKLQLF